MSYEALREIVKDSSVGLKLVEEMESTSSINVNRIADLERTVSSNEGSFNEIKDDRDRIKMIVKKNLGINSFSDDEIAAKLKTFGSSDAVAARDREIADLKKSSFDDGESFKKQIDELNSLGKRKDLLHKVTQTGIFGDLSSDLFNDMFTDAVLDGASLDENGEIVYVKDGATVYNDRGIAMSLGDKIDKIKNDPKLSKIFVESRVKGGGSPNGKATHTSGRAPNSDGLIRTKMNTQEKINYVAEYGQEQYQKLPMI